MWNKIRLKYKQTRGLRLRANRQIINLGKYTFKVLYAVGLLKLIGVI